MGPPRDEGHEVGRLVRDQDFVWVRIPSFRPFYGDDPRRRLASTSGIGKTPHHFARGPKVGRRAHNPIGRSSSLPSATIGRWWLQPFDETSPGAVRRGTRPPGSMLSSSSPVRTLASHAGDRGSNPLESTISTACLLDSRSGGTMGSPKDVGEVSEGQVIAALLRAGKVILTPFGDNQRYDLVIDNKGTFERVQCKTGRLKNGKILFPTSSSQAHRGKGRRDYRGQVETFGVYCPELDKVYMVPVSEVGRTGAHLRVDPPKNGQRKGIRLASDYELRIPIPE